MKFKYLILFSCVLTSGSLFGQHAPLAGASAASQTCAQTVQQIIQHNEFHIDAVMHSVGSNPECFHVMQEVGRLLRFTDSCGSANTARAAHAANSLRYLENLLSEVAFLRGEAETIAGPFRDNLDRDPANFYQRAYWPRHNEYGQFWAPWQTQRGHWESLLRPFERRGRAQSYSVATVANRRISFFGRSCSMQYTFPSRDCAPIGLTVHTSMNNPNPDASRYYDWTPRHIEVTIDFSTGQITSQISSDFDLQSVGHHPFNDESLRASLHDAQLLVLLNGNFTPSCVDLAKTLFLERLGIENVTTAEEPTAAALPAIGASP